MNQPMEPLKRTENAYDVSKAKPQSHTDAVLKEARGMLNKLTLTNFEKLSADIAGLDIRGPEDLKGLVGIIFDKSLEESHFCNMYAKLCEYIKDRLKEFQDVNPDPDPPPGVQPGQSKKNVTFKRCLLNKCQVSPHPLQFFLPRLCRAAPFCPARRRQHIRPSARRPHRLRQQ